MCAREPLDENGRQAGIKESARWIESYERVVEQAAALPDTRLVYVTDREGDIAALMERADELGHPADWLIRAQHNRKLAASEARFAGNGRFFIHSATATATATVAARQLQRSPRGLLGDDTNGPPHAVSHKMREYRPSAPHRRHAPHSPESMF